MKKTVHLLFLTLLFVGILGSKSIYAQINEGGTPPSFNFTITKQTKQPLQIPADFDVENLKKKDNVDAKNGIPLRMGKNIPVNLSIDNSGEWITLPNGQRIWQLTLQSPGALALLLSYDNFYIPQGAKLFIYNADKTQVIGAFTNKTNPDGKSFSTQLIAGDVLTLEYVAGDDVNDKPNIKISDVGYGYNYLSVSHGTKNFGSAQYCMVNINCPEGDNWQNQKRGVARTLTPIGGSWYLCSGTVVNNTGDELKPYYLTAHHCFYDDYGAYAGDDGLRRMQFYFNYEFSGCETTGSEPVANMMTGANMRVNIDIHGGSDGVLLELRQNIPLSYNVYYNGWDRTNSNVTNGVTIHHPGGDVKKISTFASPLGTVTWVNGSERGATNAHWEVRFTRTVTNFGVTQGGSSGSPIFNQNGLVVGTLTGGSSQCYASSNPDYYGKFWYHWDQYPNSANHMKTYLDPVGSEVLTLQGRYGTPAVPTPTDLTTALVGADEDEVQLNWNAPANLPADPVFLNKYYVYRNDVKIVETSSTSYLDRATAGVGNKLCYKVTAIYNGEKESGASNESCAFIGVPVTGFELNPATITLTVGSNQHIAPVFSPADATIQTIKSWVSDKQAVATVNAQGLVTAHNYGLATITATTTDGEFMATCLVNVTNAKDGEVKASEGFSPNGDGDNDYFIIERIEEYPDNELTVFDRRGAIHYNVKSYTNNWDGVANRGPFKGQKLPNGTYYYRLQIKGKSDIKSFVVIRY